MQTIFNAAGATAGTAGSLLTRIMNWFQAPATTNDTVAESQGQAALRELQEQLGGQIPPEMIEEFLQMHIDGAQEDLGEGVPPAGLGMVGGWDYYEEANEGSSTLDDSTGDEHDSMPDLESIPDTNNPSEDALAPHQPHAARVEDADEEDWEPTPRRNLPSTQAILRHIDSDDDNEQDVAERVSTTPTVRLSQAPPPQDLAARQAPSTSAQASSSADDEMRDPQRLQRWLLTTGLTDMQSDPSSTHLLGLYIRRLRLLPGRQQDWIVRMVRQRAGEDVEKKVRDAMTHSS
jgi:hypothetical protein